MADNTPITPGAGVTIATDDVAGVHVQKMKLVDGAADSLTPITRADLTQGLTDAQLRATPVIVDTEFGASIAVTGPATDAQLRATALPVSGPVTDAQLRATAVPVSGPVTDAQLRATAVPVAAATADGANVTMGAKIDTAWDLIAASPTLMAVLKKMALIAGDDTLVNLVRPEALTKGSQGANGFTTQPLRDAGRTLVVLTSDYLVPSAVETLVTLAWTEDLVPGAGGVSYMVPAGKKFRVQNVHGYCNAPTGNTGRADPQVWMRAAVSGDITTASPIMGLLPLISSLTPNNNAAQPIGGFDVPEGMELDALNEIGFSQLSPDWVVTTKQHRIRLVAICYLY